MSVNYRRFRLAADCFRPVVFRSDALAALRASASAKAACAAASRAMATRYGEQLT